MKYTVVWAREAEQRLTQLWLEAGVRQAIAVAADKIDEVLGRDPHSAGESREPNRRILMIWPLVVRYSVNDEDRLVTILEVKRFGR